MARHEADREDIMREAVALKRRISLALPDAAEPIVCGVRANGYWSFYLDPDRVYQFDDHFRLRRAFVNGHLYRTQGKTLARMHRERSETETALVRVDLTPAELTSFLDAASSSLTRFLTHLNPNEAIVIETIPPDADVLGEARSALQRLIDTPIALAPAITGKR